MTPGFPFFPTATVQDQRFLILVFSAPLSDLMTSNRFFIDVVAD
jgi:hypothetical protein